MQNYEALTIELLGDNITPRAKYELVKHLLKIKELYKATEQSLLSDIDWYGVNMSEYRRATHHYKVLQGEIEFTPDHDPIKKPNDTSL